MLLLLVQGSSAIHPVPFIVLSRFHGPYLTSADCLLFISEGPRLTEHFQELTFQMPVSDVTDAVFSGRDSAGCLKMCLIMIHVSVEELKKLSVCRINKSYEVLKMNSPMLES